MQTYVNLCSLLVGLFLLELDNLDVFSSVVSSYDDFEPLRLFFAKIFHPALVSVDQLPE